MKRKQYEIDEELADLKEKIRLLSTENLRLQEELHQIIPKHNFEGYYSIINNYLIEFI